MPLSEHEERILAEIERQLAEEDPRFVAQVRRRRRGLSRRTRLRFAIALGVLGVICLFGLTFSFALGAAGMSLLLVAIVLGAMALRSGEDNAEQHVPPDERT